VHKLSAGRRRDCSHRPVPPENADVGLAGVGVSRPCRERGDAVELRITSCGVTSGSLAVDSPERTRSIRHMARRPSSVKSCRTVVSGGEKYAASGRSSKPTTLTSPGTDRPDSRNAWIRPRAIWSFAANTAVTSGSSTRDRPTWKPLRALQSPVNRVRGARSPAWRSSSRHPCRRAADSDESAGPPR
jgi:hypothetical protein